ncbi:glycine zipper 2TM domain-containing protein [Ramlibacter tataouinensis]|uniref:Glycine zipper 2TM domain-containing protein n=1 Tax=Ramlibacter tataouinensis (strain ATCC BAA-407 / DSM 14655 / LMG 21543 / TTB310) TaxID=365046 RepID=F5Y3B6_RAMTT|nr:glycine zipper 2TM domain-containing protein [Ramlibacter tataouinensis]AEG91203.1 Hypothetical protein Rta_01400 [Ramlibacter tataouinensis TTB310]
MKRLVAVLMLSATAGAWAQGASHPHGVPPGQAKKHAAAAAACDLCGTVQSVRKEMRKGEGGAAGIVAGAAAGGLLGNQIGKGDGRTLATVGGAVAGGFVGNEVQKRVTTKEMWVTRVKMKDGSVRSFEQEAKPAWTAGSPVRVDGKVLVARR